MAAEFNPKACLRVNAQYKQIFSRTEQVKRNWFRKNYEKVYLNPSLPEDKIPKKAKVFYDELLKLEKKAATLREERLQKKMEVKPEEEEHKPPEEEQKLSVAELLARGPMYPVPEDVKSLLYQGISHNDEGRKLYLKTRNKKGVTIEGKFYQPITVSHKYGWLVQQRYIPANRYGRRFVIKQSFLRRNGVLKSNSHLWKEPTSGSIAGFLS